MFPVVRYRRSISPARVNAERHVDVPGWATVGHTEDGPVGFPSICFGVAVVSDAWPGREEAGVLMRMSLQRRRILKVQQRHPHDIDRQFVGSKSLHYVLLNNRGSVAA